MNEDNKIEMIQCFIVNDKSASEMVHLFNNKKEYHPAMDDKAYPLCGDENAHFNQYYQVLKEGSWHKIKAELTEWQSYSPAQLRRVALQLVEEQGKQLCSTCFGQLVHGGIANELNPSKPYFERVIEPKLRPHHEVE